MPDDAQSGAGVPAPDVQGRAVPAGETSAPERAAALDAVAEELYGVLPDDFVAARDAAAVEARDRGDRDLAKAIARLRRPTRAAWLANMLARHRRAQLDGLLGLGPGLADAQRTLDGAALRQLTAKRHQLVAAMAREAGRLAQDAGDPAAESVLRDLQGILDAALARPEVAEQVRAGRLTRTLSYTGFGPEADPDAVPTPAPTPAPPPEPAEPAPEQAPSADDAADTDTDAAAAAEAAERARAERLRAERDRREEALAAAEDEEATARERQDADEAARTDAATAREEAHRRVAELVSALDAAREQERAATAAAREAEQAAKASARAAGVAATRTARARARLDDIESQL